MVTAQQALDMVRAGRDVLCFLPHRGCTETIVGVEKDDWGTECFLLTTGELVEVRCYAYPGGWLPE